MLSSAAADTAFRLKVAAAVHRGGDAFSNEAMALQFAIAWNALARKPIWRGRDKLPAKS